MHLQHLVGLADSLSKNGPLLASERQPTGVLQIFFQIHFLSFRVKVPTYAPCQYAKVTVSPRGGLTLAKEGVTLLALATPGTSTWLLYARSALSKRFQWKGEAHDIPCCRADAGDVSWDLVGSIGRNIGPTDRLELQLGYRVSRLDDRRTQGFTGIDRFIQGPQLGFTLGI